MAPPPLTATWHHDTYPTIDPMSRPELSMRGETAVISGDGSGIGRALAQSFAEAGASTIAIRNLSDNQP
jgi:shikimate 5-dehydrogenase